MNICCIIVDDEPIARKGIESYVSKLDCLNLLGSYSNTHKIEKSTLSSVDLIFLDIKLHNTNGLEFYKKLQPHTPYAVVTSAYPEYALEGFELNVLDYLLKPFSFERFQTAVFRVRDAIALKRNGQIVSDTAPDYIFIKCDNKFQKLPYQSIVFIEGLSNYVVFHTEKKKYFSYLTMNGLIEQLPKDKFIRIHKSYIIPIDRVDAVKNHEVFINGHILAISKSYRNHFMNFIESRLIKK